MIRRFMTMGNRSMKATILIALISCLLSAGANAEDAVPAEIDYLLSAVGSSGCTFIRNGDRHSAQEAESHLRMKYRRGRRYATTTEEFIERLASSSSFSKKPYSIECEGEGAISAGDWFRKQLEEYRSGSD